MATAAFVVLVVVAVAAGVVANQDVVLLSSSTPCLSSPLPPRTLLLMLPYLRLRHLGAADAFLLEAIFRQARPVPTIALGDTIGPARHSAAHNIALSAR